MWYVRKRTRLSHWAKSVVGFGGAGVAGIVGNTVAATIIAAPVAIIGIPVGLGFG